jgi:hypothetical protein
MLAAFCLIALALTGSATAQAATIQGHAPASSPAVSKFKAVPQSSGGACSTVSNAGFRLGVCISASSNNVRPDYYLTSVGSGKCEIDYWVVHNGNTTSFGTKSCALGHHNLPGGSSGGEWYLEVMVLQNQIAVIDTDSPILSN